MDLKQKQTLNKKILITAINSSYVHMSPVPWYLNAVCPESAVTEIAEYTINDCTYKVAADIFRREPDIVTFSCYIWNIAMTEKLTSILKKTIPALTVIWGGPEVSYDCSSQMEKNSGVDYLIAGEGEEAFRRLVSRLTWDILYDTMPDGTKEAASATNEEEAAMSGIAYRKGSSIKYDGKLNKVEDLDTIPSPYSEKMLATAKGRIVYLESSRGCPFRCSYCISSVDPGVRYFNVDRIIGEIDRLKNCGARQLKFVDRTFNINKERAEKILEAVLNSGYESSFHFEIAGDLPDDKFISLMGRAPNGLIQIEAGVQTLNIKSLELVGRQTDNEKLFRNISKIISKRNIHVHLDLIAALPGDTCESFAESFNEVYKLAPDDLQLGFLKMLKGTRIRKEAGLYKYKYDDEPPYEVFSSASFSYTEIITLKDIEEVLSRYYNSRRFAFSVEYARKKLFMQPFVFYNKLAAYCRSHGFLDRPVQSRYNYRILFDFYCETAGITADEASAGYYEKRVLLLKDLMKYDYLLTDRSGDIPAFLITGTDNGNKNGKTYKADCRKITEGLKQKDMMPRGAAVNRFDHRVTSQGQPKGRCFVVFEYGSKRSAVTGKYDSWAVSEEMIEEILRDNAIDDSKKY